MRIFSEIPVSLILQSVLLSLCDRISCATFHFILSSSLEYSVRWLEFICLCFNHHFRYLMIFSAKVDIEFVFDALYWWVVSSFLLFHLDQIEWLWWCDYLAFDKSCVYIFVIFLYVYDSIPNGYVIVSAKLYKSLNIVLYLVLLNLYWEIPLWKKISVSF